MRRFLLISTVAFSLTRLAHAQSAYQIDLRDHATYISGDRPIERGRVVLFHRHPDGALVSIQKDEIARVARVPAGTTTKPLLPGELIDVGPTAGRQPETAPEEPRTTPTTGSAPYGFGWGGGSAAQYGANPSMGVPSSAPIAGPNPMMPVPNPPRGGHR